MPLAVIDWVNVLGCAKHSLLVFTGCLGPVIGNYTPNIGEAAKLGSHGGKDYTKVMAISKGKEQRI
jgi:hypothetical protein